MVPLNFLRASWLPLAPSPYQPEGLTFCISALYNVKRFLALLSTCFPDFFRRPTTLQHTCFLIILR